MNFNLDQYLNLLQAITTRYKILSFRDSVNELKSKSNMDSICCLRHDVDYCLSSACSMAELEKEHQITSSYFFLVDSINYNVLTPKGRKIINAIAEFGHEIALHFDVGNYAPEQYFRQVQLHKEILEDITGITVKSVSYHNPGAVGLENLDLNSEFCGLNNTYAQAFNKVFFYASDSLCKLKHSNLLQIIDEKQHTNLHVLIHPIWWMEQGEGRDQKININFTKKQTQLFDEYNAVLEKYGVKI